MVEIAERLRALTLDGKLDVPLPGHGRTPVRHEALFDLGREDLSLARIIEAHSDAQAILADAGRAARPGELYGVWASDGPQSRVTADRIPGGWRLQGMKQYCSGATFVTSALVTAHATDGVVLFDVRTDRDVVRALPSNWATPAFAETATGPVAFDGVRVAESALVGPPRWYLARPGFWHGALGPAACWAGGARSLIDAARNLKRRDPHSRAHQGALDAIAWGLDAVLDRAGREIDEDPDDDQGDARSRALKVRHLIERWCTEVLDRFGRATGPQLLCFDSHIARQHAALTVYIRQCHAERDLESLMAPAA
jgi:alkylation response protein AidB-like acyl-CoA dehydrogenase